MHDSQATVYVDVAALEPDTGTTAGPTRQPRALDHPALRHLDDLGHRVVLLDHGTAPPVDAEGWLVTRDPDLCGRARARPRLRSVLVGPNVPGRGLAHRPSDVEARDLTAAVLAILTAEAMPATAGRSVPGAAARSG